MYMRFSIWGAFLPHPNHQLIHPSGFQMCIHCQELGRFQRWLHTCQFLDHSGEGTA